MITVDENMLLIKNHEHIYLFLLSPPRSCSEGSQIHSLWMFIVHRMRPRISVLTDDMVEKPVQDAAHLDSEVSTVTYGALCLCYNCSLIYCCYLLYNNPFSPISFFPGWKLWSGWLRWNRRINTMQEKTRTKLFQLPVGENVLWRNKIKQSHKGSWLENHWLVPYERNSVSFQGKS